MPNPNNNADIKKTSPASDNPGQANESGEPRNQAADPSKPNDVREAKIDRRANSPEKDEA